MASPNPTIAAPPGLKTPGAALLKLEAVIERREVLGEQLFGKPPRFAVEIGAVPAKSSAAVQMRQLHAGLADPVADTIEIGLETLKPDQIVGDELVGLRVLEDGNLRARQVPIGVALRRMVPQHRKETLPAIWVEKLPARDQPVERIANGRKHEIRGIPLCPARAQHPVIVGVPLRLLGLEAEGELDRDSGHLSLVDE